VEADKSEVALRCHMNLHWVCEEETILMELQACVPTPFS